MKKTIITIIDLTLLILTITACSDFISDKQETSNEKFNEQAEQSREKKIRKLDTSSCNNLFLAKEEMPVKMFSRGE